MTDFSFPAAAAWASAAMFGAVGLVNFTVPTRILDHHLYEQWDVVPGLYRTLGMVEMVAAVCLATPSLRGWGLLLAGPIAFGSVVMLLDQQKYSCAACAVAVVAALFGAMLAVPQTPRFVVGHSASEVVIQTANNSSTY